MDDERTTLADDEITGGGTAMALESDVDGDDETDADSTDTEADGTDTDDSSADSDGTDSS